MSRAQACVGVKLAMPAPCPRYARHCGRFRVPRIQQVAEAFVRCDSGGFAA